ncbi:Lrp/AsnC family transcriptional regulator [Nocardia brasiliensis]|uniref:Lrp/AsnC family transcriptional regulator n=1 Tax=Nocardia brasiliensis TaxID=37326 RepID=UPI002B4AC02E|nr:Lrp/AsnC family transcriptional regulator [Nocardia brasiliensis]
MSLVDSLDMQLMHALAVDGRAPFSSIAEVLDCSDRTVAYRYRKLRAAGLRVVGVLNGRRLGYIEWLIRISCAPDAALAVATALARRDDTFWVHLASGGTEIVCITRTRGAGDQWPSGQTRRRPRQNLTNISAIRAALEGTMWVFTDTTARYEWRRSSTKSIGSVHMSRSAPQHVRG